MLTRFDQILQEECQIPADGRLLVGVSGGPDSLTLLHLLHALGRDLTVAHFNHHLRPEADEDEHKVAQIAAGMKVAFVSGSEEVDKLASAMKLSVEAAARKARYRFLFEQARRIDADGVVTGHTADDQVETILLHFLRGSGLDGLKGMDYRTYLAEFSTEIPLLRPLLAFWRTEILEYCRKNKLQPLTDASNQDVKYTRNRVRKELLPILQSFNPQIKQRLWSLGQITAGSLEILRSVIQSSYEDVCIEEGAGFVAFKNTGLAGYERGAVETILREAARKLAPDGEDLTWSRLRQASQAILDGKRNGQLDLADNLSVVYCQDRLYLARNGVQIVESSWPAYLKPESEPLAVPGRVELENGFFISVESLDVGSPDSFRYVLTDRNEAWLDAAVVKETLQSGPAGNYKKFQPLGMESGSVSLGDYFTNKKLPRPARNIWPVIADGERVAWVPGFVSGHPWRVTPKTRRVLHLKLEQAQKKTG
jgi:tRNA(Ile)-lysidine synthase